MWKYFVQGAGLVTSPNIEDLYKFLGLHYESDWGQLMKVVERINDLNNVVEIHENLVMIVSNESGKIIIQVIRGSMKEAVYCACVKFAERFKERQ